MEAAPLTVILADDHGIIREGVAAFCKGRISARTVQRRSGGAGYDFGAESGFRGAGP